MKTYFLFFFAAVVICACQQKQFYKESPEIDLVKKSNEAYFKGDWETLRSFFADTATIYDNTWGNNKLTPEKNIETIRMGLADYTEYKMSEGAEYEMVVNDRGEHWVYNWFEWVGKHKTGKEARSVVHIGMRVENNKIVFAGFIYDRLAGFMAAQPDSVVTK